MRDVALVPERHVLGRRHLVAAQHAREAADPLAELRIALVRHGAGAGLAFTEGLFGFEYFRALEVPDLEREPLQRRPDERDRLDELRVTVTADDLRAHRLRTKSEPAAD